MQHSEAELFHQTPDDQFVNCGVAANQLCLLMLSNLGRNWTAATRPIDQHLRDLVEIILCAAQIPRPIARRLACRWPTPTPHGSHRRRNSKNNTGPAFTGPGGSSPTRTRT
jgi:hypothetical protein